MKVDKMSKWWKNHWDEIGLGIATLIFLYWLLKITGKI